MLQSRLNQKKGPCLYVCPNKYLVEQTAQEAEKFGIGYVTIDDSLPDEFLNSEKILITHVQKVFNGKSKFGVGGKFQKVNTVILDDSHACIDSINDSFKIKVNNEHQLYKKLLQLNDYFIFECKSKVEDSRKEITKTETGQMNNHCGWFDQEYNAEQVKRILIIPTKNVSHQGNFTHHVEIMRKGKLKLLRDNVKSFFKEFKDYQLDEISDYKIQEWIQIHKLDVESLKSEYSEDYYQK
ncbi:hypothetical protein [Okeania sp. SIO1I7]|uniref:hypothetical protein n=1 Tax=Okeania sp. SIO1I7 TaxID=2607772 RepID=UPI0035C87F06